MKRDQPEQIVDRGCSLLYLPTYLLYVWRTCFYYYSTQRLRWIWANQRAVQDEKNSSSRRRWRRSWTRTLPQKMHVILPSSRYIFSYSPVLPFVHILYPLRIVCRLFLVQVEKHSLVIHIHSSTHHHETLFDSTPIIIMRFTRLILGRSRRRRHTMIFRSRIESVEGSSRVLPVVIVISSF